MKYNKKSPYEKPLSECPARCAECQYFDESYFCRANGIVEPTCSFSNPKDRPVPFPLNCFWWYANNVFDKMNESKANGYKEARIHRFVASKMLFEMSHGKERKEFLDYFYRPGGGKLIEFEKYPEAREIYEYFKVTEL